MRKISKVMSLAGARLTVTADIPDMLLDLKMDERLEELLSHDNEVIQRCASRQLWRICF